MWSFAIAAVAVLHAAYLLFQGFGALLVLRDIRWLWAHLTAVTWGVLIVVVQGRCPLTVLERSLIARSGGVPYEESYLDHYLYGTVLPDGSQPLVYALHLLGIAATYVYVTVYVLRRRARPPAAGADVDGVPTAHGSASEPPSVPSP